MTTTTGRTPGLVVRLHNNGIHGEYYRWDVKTAEAFSKVLDKSPVFRDQIIAEARGAVRNAKSYPMDAIRKVTKGRGKATFNVEVELADVKPNCQTRTKRIRVPVSDPSSNYDYDLRGAFGKPVVLNS